MIFSKVPARYFIHVNTIFCVFYQLKKFVKECKVGNYTKQIKQIVEKVEENSRVITQRRKTATLNLADSKGIVSV